jgi:transitional endoplasmic reticulum ATPase
MFADDVDPVALGRASQGMSGADLREVLRRAQLDKAMREASTGDRPPPIDQDDLLRAITTLRRAL